eukprot:scaffold7805_cov116-Isochrysis_galbana.AAC.2
MRVFVLGYNRPKAEHEHSRTLYTSCICIIEARASPRASAPSKEKFVTHHSAAAALSRSTSDGRVNMTQRGPLIEMGRATRDTALGCRLIDTTRRRPAHQEFASISEKLGIGTVLSEMNGTAVKKCVEALHISKGSRGLPTDIPYERERGLGGPQRR